MDIQFTKKRLQILEVLKASKDAVSASSIHSSLPQIDLATIYRNLDLFTKAGLVKKLQLDDEALYEYQETPHHHAVCNNCDKIIHFTIPKKDLAKLVKVKDFIVEDVDVTVRGNCRHE